MDIQITARHFKAHDSLREYAYDAVKRLERYYNGIVKADVRFSYERSHYSLKTVEIHIKVYGNVLKATDKSEDFNRSIDAAVEKMERQLMKYKSRLYGEDKRKGRFVREFY